MNPAPKIIYVPGLLPKPPADIHHDALFRCLKTGVERIDAHVAEQLEATPDSFENISWTFDFYGEHRDFALDAAAVDALVAQEAVTKKDRDEAKSLKRRITRWVLRLADKLPFLIPYVANERMRLHLRDLRHYLKNHNEAAEHTRNTLKIALRAARDQQRPILLIAHSMGSIIAYESLWQMSRANREPMHIDLLLTMGSPLGQHYMQRRLKGNDAIGAVRYPCNIRRWINLSAEGDMTSIDPTLRTDFAAMLAEELVESIEDLKIYNWFRLDGVLNPHAEYGYLINPDTARIVIDWWKSASPDPDSAG